MPTQEMLYTIEELANLTETKVRTIRYYIVKGLMPVRETRGRCALYTNAHLQRLQLILKIKAANLPLETIKSHLNSVSDENIASLLTSETQTEKKRPRVRTVPGPDTEVGESPAAYIARVLNHHKTLVGLRSTASPAVSSVKPALADDFQSETVQRLEIFPDVRLEFKIPLDAKTQERIERILACVREMD